MHLLDSHHYLSKPAPLEAHLLARLAERREQHLARRRLVLESPQGAIVRLAGQQYLSFCSNDYLGLANHPKVIEAFKQGVNRYGVGSGASHLISGHSEAHHKLEEELAEFTGRQSALLFSSGYMANLGVITALLDDKDVALSDRLNHASLIDAVKLSGARLRRYLHADSLALENKLLTDRSRHKLIVTDGVFSMDGDLAPLPVLAEIARKNQAWLMVDDAHGLGVIGEGGRGTLSHFNVTDTDAQVLMGTLGKSLGVFGAFVAGSEALIETLIQFARSYVYTTALPPAVAQAARQSLALLQTESWRQDKLVQLIKRFQCGAAQLGISLLPSQTPIQPVLVGDAAKVMQISQHAKDQGILLSAIRAPTVAKGSERLRITLSADHEEAQIDRLLSVLEEIL